MYDLDDEELLAITSIYQLMIYQMKSNFSWIKPQASKADLCLCNTSLCCGRMGSQLIMKNLEDFCFTRTVF